MEKERKNLIPKAARYPLFLIGLLIIILGELGSGYVHAADTTEAGLAVIGFIFVIISVLPR
jgi:hypothetical protein